MRRRRGLEAAVPARNEPEVSSSEIIATVLPLPFGMPSSLSTRPADAVETIVDCYRNKCADSPAEPVKADAQ